VPDVPSCPGWNVTDLVLHLGGVHRHVARIIREKQREHVPISRDDLGWLGLGHPHLHWLMTGHAPRNEPLPPEVLAWFEEGASELEAVFRQTDPDEPVWTWSPEKRVGFWLRTQAIEAAVHRWDAQFAHGVTQPIDAELAADGIDHTFEYMLPARREWAEAPEGSGETYHFHRTDGPGEWTVRLDRDGVEVTREHGKGNVTIRGAASDLLLWLWRRIPASQMEVFGDAALLDRYFELVPPR
jgi:uncharacterized protein (TIGR03083 family)